MSGDRAAEDVTVDPSYSRTTALAGRNRAGAMEGGRDNGASGHGALNRDHVAHTGMRGLKVFLCVCIRVAVHQSAYQT